MSVETLDEMGSNGRKIVETYDQPLLVDKLCEIITYVQEKK